MEAGWTTLTAIGTGAGQFDGPRLRRVPLGSSWADSSIYRFENGAGGRVIKGVPSQTDIGYDASGTSS
jgi:hypothetical protein